MSEDQFTKLFVYMEKKFDRVDTQLEQTATQSSLDGLINTIDQFVKRLDDNETEQVSRDAQFDRLLDWARKVSKQTGIPLENL